MKRIALGSLAILLAAGVANADPSTTPDRTSSRFALFPAELSVSLFEVPGTLGGDHTFASAINENRAVAGWGYTDSNQIHAFVWFPGDAGVDDLDELGGANMMAFGINDNGVVVGWRMNFNNAPEAFVWSNGTVKYLPAPSFAFDVNNANRVVGAANLGSGLEAVVWQFNATDGSVSAPSSLLDERPSVARAINDFGDVAGWFVTSGEIHGFVKKAGQAREDVGVAFGNFSDAYGLNSSAWATGETGEQSGGDRHVFLWSSDMDPPIVDLEPIAGKKSIGYGLSSDGFVVGMSNASGAMRAVLWGDGEFRMDLGSLGGSDVDVAFARAVNGSGQIAGYSARSDGLTRATIWTLTEVTTPPPPDLTAEEKIDRLIAQVEGMSDLNKGQATSLIMKLKAAKRQVQRENERAARNIIRAFTLQVHAFLRGAILDDAESLLEAAGEIL